jgi:hypothetical protein
MRKRYGLWLAALLLPAALSADGLDNSSWKVRVVPDKRAAAEGATSFQDSLVFSDGKLLVAGFVRYGFEPEAYAAQESAAGGEWTARLRGPQGAALWQGSVKADAVTGTLVWHKPDDRVHQYTFAGQRRRGGF